jgi:hypothetical protein
MSNWDGDLAATHDTEQVAGVETDPSTSATEMELQPIDGDGDGLTDGYWGVLQTGEGVVVLDPDGNRAADELRIDTDGDGYVDIVVSREGTGYHVYVDDDHDGTMDDDFSVTTEELAAQAPDLSALLAVELPLGTDSGVDGDTSGDYPDVTEDGTIVGDPFGASDYWFNQAWNGSCVPASIAQVISVYTGEQFTDLDLIDAVNAVGGWSVGPDGVPGMTPDAAEEVFDYLGIPADSTHSDLDELTGWLAEGRGVVVFVDADEIWGGADDGVADDYDHAVVITGIDSEAGLVYLSDTGTPDGNLETVPLEVFLGAWEDSGNAVVSVDMTADEYRESVADVEADQAGTETGSLVGGVGGPADQHADAELSLASVSDRQQPYEQVLSFVAQQHWVLIPVLLGAGAAISAGIGAVAPRRTR